VTAAVRPAAAADAAGIAAVYAPYVTEGVASFEEVAPDAAEMRARMLRDPRLPWFVAVRDGTVVGFASSARHRDRAAYRWSADCSAYLTAAERGRGTARALYAQLLPALRALGYVSAFAGIALPNDASAGFHEALGFTPVGVYAAVGYKHGAWRDVGWWQRALVDPLPAEPAEPRPWKGP
jgi:L-amino acid N-acyltransferase YncA